MGQCAVDHVKTVLVFQLVFQTTDICFHSLKLKKKICSSQGMGGLDGSSGGTRH